MNLKNKKQLASRTLGVGAGRIAFRNERVDEIKEAITKQDIRDLVEAGAIVIKEIKGKRKKIRGKRREGANEPPVTAGKNIKVQRLERQLNPNSHQILYWNSGTLATP